MNQRPLARLNRIWTACNLVRDSANLDFTTLPDWCNESIGRQALQLDHKDAIVDTVNPILPS